MKRRILTPEQQAARDERRAKFRALWKRVGDMPELERVQMANKLGLHTVDGHELSLCNTMLVALQNPAASVVGGFRQWIGQGRAVRKGEHGCMIWVPIGGKKSEEAAAPTEPGATEDAETRFIIGTVFDVGQTEEITTA